jgi:hypothetical protein
MRDQIIKSAKSKIVATEGSSRASDASREEVHLVNDILDERLLSLEQMLDAGIDASLQAGELRELRQLCSGLRALARKVPGLPE